MVIQEDAILHSEDVSIKIYICIYETVNTPRIMYSMPWEDNMLDAQLNEHPK